ncbi:MAG: hypothetical protein FJX62_03400 [Alphaproteobacteria bacterium]|nr:hypothetical protein [Alphaproteobacteria bacterium]
MSTTTQTPAAQSSSLVQSYAFRTFAVVFAIAAPVIYTICEIGNLPLFTYHPGTNRVEFGFARSVRDQGPAMHWYGWTASTLLGSAILGLIAAKLPESLTRKIPLALVWIAPLAVIPVLIYALRFFWRW